METSVQLWGLTMQSLFLKTETYIISFLKACPEVSHHFNPVSSKEAAFSVSPLLPFFEHREDGT